MRAAISSRIVTASSSIASRIAAALVVNSTAAAGGSATGVKPGNCGPEEEKGPAPTARGAGSDCGTTGAGIELTTRWAVATWGAASGGTTPIWISDVLNCAGTAANCPSCGDGDAGAGFRA